MSPTARAELARGNELLLTELQDAVTASRLVIAKDGGDYYNSSQYCNTEFLSDAFCSCYHCNFTNARQVSTCDLQISAALAAGARGQVVQAHGMFNSQPGLVIYVPPFIDVCPRLSAEGSRTPNLGDRSSVGVRQASIPKHTIVLSMSHRHIRKTVLFTEYVPRSRRRCRIAGISVRIHSCSIFDCGITNVIFRIFFGMVL